MSSFTDRIRARTRRHNERQARAQGQPQTPRPRVVPELAPLGLDEAQGAAIRKALASASINEATVQRLVAEGKLTWAEIEGLHPSELAEFAEAIRRYEEREQTAAPAKLQPVAPPGNAPGEFDLGQLEETPPAYMTPEQLDDPSSPDAQGAGSEQSASLSAAATPSQPEATATADASLDRLEFPKSSNVRAAMLDANGVVTVEFGDGKRYRYARFTRELMKDWSEAKSAGGWFHKNIRSKPGQHPVIES